MRNSTSTYNVNFVVQLTPVVKYLMIVNAGLWVLATLILQSYVFKNTIIFDWFGMVPNSTVFGFKLWQPFTYMFLHSSHINHILFNMLLLWWVGSQIEITMGSRRFLKFYLACGVGAGLLYLLILYFIYYVFGVENANILTSPVIGASGAVFGLLVAYAVFHGENIVYFMMLFPMRAKYFVSILILLEVFVLVTAGFEGPVANLAHLGGIIIAFVYLYSERWWMRSQTNKFLKKNNSKHLKLVVDNERKAKIFH